LTSVHLSPYGLFTDFFKAPVPSGRTLTVVLSRSDMHCSKRNYTLFLQSGKEPLPNAFLAPVVEADINNVNNVPISKFFRQGTLFATVFDKIKHGVYEFQCICCRFSARY
jgi:hypothetical protein